MPSLWDRLQAPWSQKQALDLDPIGPFQRPQQPQEPTEDPMATVGVDDIMPPLPDQPQAPTEVEPQAAGMDYSQLPVVGLDPDQQMQLRFMMDGGRAVEDVNDVALSMHTDNERMSAETERRGMMDTIGDWWMGRDVGMEKPGAGLMTSLVPFMRPTMIRDELIQQHMAGMRKPDIIDRPVAPGADAYRADYEAMDDGSVMSEFRNATKGIPEFDAIQDPETMRDVMAQLSFEQDARRLETSRGLKAKAAAPSAYEDWWADPVMFFDILSKQPAFMGQLGIFRGDAIGKVAGAVGLAAEVSAKTQARMSPTLKPDAEAGTVEILKAGEDMATAFRRAAAETGIEYGTEMAGGSLLKATAGIGRLAKAPFRKLATTKPIQELTETLLARVPGPIRDQVSKIVGALAAKGRAGNKLMAKLGYHGIKGELLEEAVAAPLHAVAGTQEFQTEPWQQALLDASESEVERKMYQTVWAVQNFVQNAPTMAIAFAVPGMATAGLNMVLDKDTGFKLKPGETLSDGQKSTLTAIAEARMQAIASNEDVPTSVMGQIFQPWKDSTEYDWLKENKDNPEELYRVYGGWTRLEALKTATGLPADLVERLATAKDNKDFSGVAETWAVQQGLREQFEDMGLSDSDIDYVLSARSNADTMARANNVQRRMTAEALKATGTEPMMAERLAMIQYSQGTLSYDDMLAAGIAPEVARQAMVVKNRMDAFLQSQDARLRTDEIERMSQEFGRVITPSEAEIRQHVEAGDYGGKEGRLRLMLDMEAAWQTEAGLTAEEAHNLVNIVTADDVNRYLAGDYAALSFDTLAQRQDTLATWTSASDYQMIAMAAREFAQNPVKIRSMLEAYYIGQGIPAGTVMKWLNSVRQSELQAFISAEDPAVFTPERMAQRMAAVEERQARADFNRRRIEDRRAMTAKMAEEGAPLEDQIAAVEKYMTTLRSEGATKEALKEANLELTNLMATKARLEAQEARESRRRHESIVKAVEKPQKAAETAGETDKPMALPTEPTPEAEIDRILKTANNRGDAEDRATVGKWYRYESTKYDKTIDIKILAINATSGTASLDTERRVIGIAGYRVPGGIALISIENPGSTLKTEIEAPVDTSDAPAEALRWFDADESGANTIGVRSYFSNMRATYNAGTYAGTEAEQYYRLANLKERFSDALASFQMPRRRTTEPQPSGADPATEKGSTPVASKAEAEAVTAEEVESAAPPSVADIDGAVNRRKRDDLMLAKGQYHVPGLRLQDQETAGAMAYMVEKGEATIEDWNQWIDRARSENRFTNSDAAVIPPTVPATATTPEAPKMGTPTPVAVSVLPRKPRSKAKAKAALSQGWVALTAPTGMPDVDAIRLELSGVIRGLAGSIGGMSDQEWREAYQELWERLAQIDEANGLEVKRPKPKKKGPRLESPVNDPYREAIMEFGGVRPYKADESGVVRMQSEYNEIAPRYRSLTGLAMDVMADRLNEKFGTSFTEDDIPSLTTGAARREFRAEDMDVLKVQGEMVADAMRQAPEGTEVELEGGLHVITDAMFDDGDNMVYVARNPSGEIVQIPVEAVNARIQGSQGRTDKAGDAAERSQEAGDGDLQSGAASFDVEDLESEPVAAAGAAEAVASVLQDQGLADSVMESAPISVVNAIVAAREDIEATAGTEADLEPFIRSALVADMTDQVDTSPATEVMRRAFREYRSPEAFQRFVQAYRQNYRGDATAALRLAAADTDDWIDGHPGAIPEIREAFIDPPTIPAAVETEVATGSDWVPAGETTRALIDADVEGQPRNADLMGGKMKPWAELNPAVKARLVRIAAHVAVKHSVGDDAELMVAIAEAFRSDAMADRFSDYFPDIWTDARAEIAKLRNKGVADDNAGTTESDSQRSDTAPESGGTAAGSRRPLDDDGRRRILGGRDVGAIRSTATVDAFLSGAQQTGIPAERAQQSVDDAAAILRSYDAATKHTDIRKDNPDVASRRAVDSTLPDKPRVALLGYATGTGKTFMGAMVLKEVSDRLTSAGKKPRILWLTVNKGLIAQAKSDTKAYGLEGVEFRTYADMRSKFDGANGRFRDGSMYDGRWDFVFFDEAHAMKNIKDGRATAMAGQALMTSADMSVYATATPFEDPSQLAYLKDSGIFDRYPGGYRGWAEQHGVDRNGTWHPSQRSALAAQRWLKSAGVLMIQEAELPEGFVTANLMKVQLTGQQIDVVNRIDRSFRTVIAEARRRGHAGAVFNLKAMHLLLTRRTLEDFKVSRTFELLEKEVAEAKAKGENRKWLVMSAYKSEKDIAAKALEMTEKAEADGSPFRAYYARALAELSDITMASPIEAIIAKGKELGLNPVEYSGNITSPQRRSEYLQEFRDGRSRLMVATIDAGGTGLSAHDVEGSMPISQIIMTMPWTGTKLTQAAGRTARYGMKTPVVQHYIFANDATEARLAALVGTRLKAMRATVNGMEDTPNANEMIRFDMGMDQELIPESDAPTMGLPMSADPSQQPTVSGPMQHFSGQRPAWMNQPPLDPVFAKLRTRIMADDHGDVGVRSITEALTTAFDIEYRTRREQTSRRSPANMLPRTGTTFPGTGQGGTVPRNVGRTSTPLELDINAHEIGHGLMSMDYGETVAGEMLELMGSDNPQWGAALIQAVKPLADRKVYPDSAASSPNTHEAFAEWVRRYVTRPQSFQDRATVTMMEAYLEKHHPAWLNALRGAALAYEAHLNRSAEVILTSNRLDVPRRKSSVTDMLTRVAQDVFRRAGVLDINDNLLFRATVRALRRAGASTAEANRIAREQRATVKDSPADVKMMYQNVVRLPGMIEQAMTGDGIQVPFTSQRKAWFPGDPQLEAFLHQQLGDLMPSAREFGEFVKFSDSVKTAITDLVPDDEFEHWVSYGDYKAAVARYKVDPVTGAKTYLSYPGMRDMTPTYLQQEIDRMEREHPQWLTAFKNVERIYDGALLMTMVSGQMSPREFFRIKGYELEQNRKTGEYRATPRVAKDGTVGFSDYWYLLRNNDGDHDVGYMTDATEPMLRLHRARGSGMPFADFTTAIRKRVGNALSAWANRQALAAVIMNAEAGATNTNLPPEVRRMYGRVITPLRPDLRQVATIGPHEDLKIRERVAAYMTQKDPQNPVTAEDVDLHFVGMPIMRKQKPNAKNVIVFYEGSKPRFFQIEDQHLFDLFARQPELDRFMKSVDDIQSPLTRKAKNKATQNWIYAIRNSLMRDPLTAGWTLAGEQAFNGDVRTYIPHFHLMYGLYKMATGSDVMKHINPELWSRAFEVHKSGRAQFRDETMLDIFKDGVVIDGWQNMSMGERAKMTPGIAFSFLTNWIDVFNTYTGGKWGSKMLELAPRIGAAELARTHGASMMKALQIADSVTGDFGHRPLSNSMNLFNRIAGFRNANNQIRWQFWSKALDADPKVRHEVWMRWAATSMSLRLAAVAMGVSALLATAKDDDDKKKRLKAIMDRPIEDRMRSQSVLGFKLPFENGTMGVIESLIVIAVENEIVSHMDAGRNPEWIHDYVKRLWKNLTTADGSPVWYLGDTLLSSVAAPPVKAVVEAGINRSFFRQGPVVPEYLSLDKRGDPYAAVFESTPKAYPWLSAMTGSRVSPLKIQYVMQNAVMSAAVDDAVKAFDSVFGNRPIGDRADVPMAGRLFTRAPTGWNSQPVKDVAALEDSYRAAKLLWERKREDRTLPRDSEEYRNAAEAYYRLVAAHGAYERTQQYANRIKLNTKRAYAETDKVRQKQIMDRIAADKERMTEVAAQALNLFNKRD